MEPCLPGNLYKGGLPTWNPPATNQEAICTHNLLGLNSPDTCYSECFQYPIPCYGYALNIATPENWTYPGLRHLNTEPDVNNCSQLITQTEADGSTYVGMSEPTQLDPDQHIFVAYAANGQYHYARKDTDTNTWSSKNGDSQPSRLDNNNKPITDPATAYFNLKGTQLTFCGYFKTSNNAVCPSASDCVKGQQYGPNGAWPNCGNCSPPNTEQK